MSHDDRPLLHVTRREFMVGAAGLTFGVLLPGCAGLRPMAPQGAMLAAAPATSAQPFNPWVSIATDGAIYIQSPAVEMGQGSLTSLPLIVAEELDADWVKVRIVPAPPDDKLYGNPGFGGQMYTAGSNAVRSYFQPLRTFGAQVRRVLLDNAARRWNVPVAELSTEPGVMRIVRLTFGVGVIAETPWAAFAAKDALRVTWDRRGTGWGFDSDAAIARYAAAARDLTTPGKPWDKVGDVSAATAKAATVLEAEFSSDYAYHAQMEPLNSVASVSPAGDACEIWVGSQGQTMAVAAVAKALGIPPAKVRLNNTLLGGGFGRRGHRDEEFVVDSVLLSKEVRRPVKLMWTREDDVRNGRFRPMSAHYLRAGLDASGRIVAWQHRVACDWVTPFMDPVRFKGAMRENDVIAIAGSEIRTYDVPNRLAEQLGQQTGIRTSPLRGIGFVANKFATEAFLDEIAEQRRLDPVALRLELLKDTPRGQAVVTAVVEMSEYRRPRSGRTLGFAFIDYSNTMVAGVAEVSIHPSARRIRVHNFWCAIDPGIAVQPDNVVAQTESSIVYGLGLALTERITVKNGVVQQSNFYDYQVPRMRDVPQMHVRLMPTPHPPTGVGQMATPLIAPAIASAVHTATKKRLRHTPFTPERVRAALSA